MSIELTAAQALTIGRIIDGYGPLAGNQITVSGLPGASTEYPGTLHVYYAPMAHGYRVLTDGTAVRVS